jgi:hypothetical protein
MRTTLFRLLPAAVLALPLLALAAFAQDKPAAAQRCAGAAQAIAAPQAPVQQIPYTPPQDLGFPEGPPKQSAQLLVCPPPGVCTPPQPAPTPAPTLEGMVAELRQLREREKQLAAAIREKVKEQRKTLDDAEREVGGGAAAPHAPVPTVCW